MRMIFTIILSCAVLAACYASVGPTTAQPLVENSNASGTFETSETARRTARDQGLPVLLRGQAAKYPDFIDPSAVEHGWVNLRLNVLPNGRVGDVHIIDASNEVFHAAAVASVKSWIFETSTQSQEFYQRVFIHSTQADHYQPSIETQ